MAELINCKPLCLPEPLNQTDQADSSIDVGLGEPEPTIDPSFSVRDILKNVFGVAFGLVPHWKITAQEVDMLSDAWGGALDY